MPFIVRFTDKPDSLPVRQELLPAHLQWLEAHRDLATHEIHCWSKAFPERKVPV
jgi:uncharacterized protein YciI